MSYSGEGNLIEAVVFGDPTKTVVPVVCDSDGRLLIDLDGSAITLGRVEIEDTNGGPLTSIDGSLNVNVTNSTGSEKATDAIGTEEEVFQVKTALLAPNLSRKGFVIDTDIIPVYIWLGNTAVPTYRLTPRSILEVENFVGPVFGSVDSGSSVILVTEKI